MNKKSLASILVIAFALMLAACNSMRNIASSLVFHCPPTSYYTMLWSPDGKHIAYEAQTSGDPLQLYVMNADGTEKKRLSPNVSYTGLDLQWLPDSQALAYSDNYKIHILALDGTHTAISLPTTSIVNFRFSPNGKTIIFSSLSPDGNTDHAVLDIYAANSDGSQITQLTNDQDYYNLEQWSPDGFQIAFNNWSQPSFVSLIKVDGTDQRHLVTGSGPVRWSPDGEWLSYFGEGRSELHIIRPDGTDDRLITQDADTDNQGWLPDNRHISYVGLADGLSKLIDIDTLAVETLTTVATEPRLWSPDGARALLQWDDNSIQGAFAEDIYVVNRHDTGLTRLTDNPGRYQCFNWPF